MILRKTVRALLVINALQFFAVILLAAVLADEIGRQVNRTAFFAAAGDPSHPKSRFADMDRRRFRPDGAAARSPWRSKTRSQPFPFKIPFVRRRMAHNFRSPLISGPTLTVTLASRVFILQSKV